MTHNRKMQFWIDNTHGTLVEFTSDVNQVDLEKAVDILDNTSINMNDKSRLSGIREAKIPINGFGSDVTTGLEYQVDQAQGTSVSRTWQIKKGSRYYNGEGYPAGLKVSGDGKKLSAISFTLDVDGAVNSTTVAL